MERNVNINLFKATLRKFMDNEWMALSPNGRTYMKEEESSEGYTLSFPEWGMIEEQLDQRGQLTIFLRPKRISKRYVTPFTDPPHENSAVGIVVRNDKFLLIIGDYEVNRSIVFEPESPEEAFSIGKNLTGFMSMFEEENKEKAERPEGPMKAFATIGGDKQVGIPDKDFLIEDSNGVDPIFYYTDDVSRDDIRGFLREGFWEAFDGPTRVIFSDECPDCLGISHHKKDCPNKFEGPK